jgi:hypothetical protein
MQGRSLRLAGGAIFSPWFTLWSLAMESSEVIGLRVVKLAGGGVDAHREAHLIVSEKVDAIFEASARLILGATPIDVAERFREQVAANARRLAPRSRKSVRPEIDSAQSRRPGSE